MSKEKPKGEYGSKDEAGYADPGLQGDKQPRYPLKEGGQLSEKRIRAAWNYINKPANSGKYSAKDAAAIKRRIISAWKAKIDKDGPPSAKSGEKWATGDALAKWNDGLYNVQTLAGLLAS